MLFDRGRPVKGRLIVGADGWTAAAWIGVIRVSGAREEEPGGAGRQIAEERQMIESGAVLDVAELGVRLEVRTTSRETGGELVEFDVAGRARGS